MKQHYFVKVIKIPKEIFIYSLKKSVLIFYSSLEVKAIKFNGSVTFLKHFNLLVLLKKFHNTNKFYKSPLYKSYETLFKKLCKSIRQFFKKKLLLVGVGFKLSLVKKDTLSFLECKLGYSHSIFLKIPRTVTITIPKPNKIYLLSPNFLILSQLASLLKTLKAPDCYKGKGFKYDYEKLVLKKGKKI